MNWDKLLSVKRLGKKTSSTAVEEMRLNFREISTALIFSSPFRRLQNKTQVFPLPGSVFVHNRLTHSLEVAALARSLGNMISLKFAEKDLMHPLISEIGQW
jgi:dGTPase